MQCGDASGTGVFDTAQRVFDKERMSSIDSNLHTFFPDLIGPNEVIFSLSPCVPLQHPGLCNIWVQVQLECL